MTSLPNSRKPGRQRASGKAPPWWFAAPAMLLFAFVVLVPSARGVYYAFTDWDGLSPDFSWVGFGNFTAMLDDPTARQAIWHTLLIAVAVTVIQNGVGLLLALGVNSVIKSRNVLRVFLFAPAIITPIVTAYLWRNLLFALTGGGPGHATDTISTLIYKEAFTLGEFGYSIALAVVLTIIVAVVSTGQYFVLSRGERAAS
jgi:ABC-type sugar transport system permease subunit